MQETKDNRANRKQDEASEAAIPEGEEAPPEEDQDGGDGWRQYRRWVSTRRRAGIDRSLYTWKGYRTWTEQVKRNWSDS